MKTRPEDSVPPRYLSSRCVQQQTPQEKNQTPAAVSALKTHMLSGRFHVDPERRTGVVQNVGLITGRRSAVVLPRLRLPATPPPSTFNPTPPQPSSPQPEGQQSQTNTPASSSCLPPPLHPELQKDEVPVKEKLLQDPDVEPDVDLNIRLAGSTPPASLNSLNSLNSLSQGSLSDFSRPSSSLFSRSTDLCSGRSSVLSDKTNADILNLDSEGSTCLPPLHSSSTMSLLLASPSGSDLHQSSSSTKPPLFDRTEPLSPLQASSFPLKSDEPPNSSSRSTKTAENLQLDPSLGPDLNPSLDSDRGRATPAFPSTTWSSCPSPQRTTPLSGSPPNMTPSPSTSRLESHRWTVLPPISPVRGRSAASHCSELSCTQSCVFDELEAIAPPSASCLSLDELSDSSGSPSPDTDLSPGLAALTVGCDSGNLGSLSRVQLLLLDRRGTEDLLSPSGLEEEEVYPLEEDWSDLMQYDPPGASRSLTAGSVSERCDSAGKVRGNTSNQSEGGSDSPSSWIIDPSPSFNMFRSSSSSCRSNHGSHSDDGGPSEEESIHPGLKDQAELLDGGRRAEERKTKALNMLSKLQDNTPRQRKTIKERSNFEDFDFLAKYCIFSQEKLVEYKRAFEAEDNDADGYISCLQVLLALKSITPPELLSDEEEIYVYRILEMVDFRVTDGLVDLRLFAVIASLAQKISSMDEFMRSLITNMDFRSLEVRLFKAKQLFLFLLEEQRGSSGSQQGFISAEQLLLELKAGGIHLDQEAAVRLELQHVPPLDLLDFLAYLPLFMLIHKAVISNPLDDSSNL